MVEDIKRDKSDIFGWPIIGFMFKNPKFLFVLKSVVLGIFLYAIAFAFFVEDKDNLFTEALFWALFWPLFMVVTLVSFGRIFCGICPHGFVGKYLTKYGLKKSMPQWMQNRYIGITLLAIIWWGLYYMYPSLFRTGLSSALLFLGVSVVAFGFYYVYKDMDYCKYICPIGAASRSFSKMSFMKLGSYGEECSSCDSFSCAASCPHGLKPFTFENKKTMGDCTLCMDCADSCEAIHFKITKPSESIFKKFQPQAFEVWIVVLITAAITISMNFHHALGRTAVASDMLWTKSAEFFKGFIDFGSLDAVGLFAFLYAMAITIIFVMIGMKLTSEILKVEYKKTFNTLGYAFIPIFIIGGFSHTAQVFFHSDFHEITNGFIQAFGLGVDYIEPLANRGEKWLRYFSLFNYIAVIWAFVILYKRLGFLTDKISKKLLSIPLAGSLILLYLFLNLYVGYAFAKYGAAKHGHHHGATQTQIFQSVKPQEAVIVQSGENSKSGVVCGMDLVKFYKTNHSATLDGVTRQYCSLHCLVEDLHINKLPLQSINVIDVNTLKFIDAKRAFYVVGSEVKGTMSMKSKYAFGTLEGATTFMKKHGGEIKSFDEASAIALKDFSK